MHSLNSIAGIKRYRIQDEIPIAIDDTGNGPGEIAGVGQDSGGKVGEKVELTSRSRMIVAVACATLVRITSRIYKSLPKRGH